jgi:hypothetical protein
MAKIPVGATIAQAYRFAFADFLKILGVMWLAMAIMWIPGLIFRSQMAAVASHDPAAIRQMLPFLVPFYLVAFVLISMQMIGLAKLALGVHRGPGWIYFSLGKPVWRLIGSLLLLIVAMIVGWLIALLAGFLTGLLLGLLAKAVNFQPLTVTIGFAIAISVIAIWCGYIYSAIRLTFLLLPVIADEREGFALGHAWNLGKGNFWRMFAVLLLILLPLLIVEAGVFVYLFQGISFPHAPVTAEQSAAFQAALNAHMMAMINGIYRYWYLAYPTGAIVTIFFYGMAVSAQCFAYRAVTEGSAPVAGDGLPD